MTRLVCRSAPLPTRALARQMEDDEWWRRLLSAAEERGVHVAGLAQEWVRLEPVAEARRTVLAAPKDTDNSQCWSEEIFSLLT